LLNQVKTLFHPAHGTIAARLPEHVILEESKNVLGQTMGVTLGRQ
jgi:hypothetical protein